MRLHREPQRKERLENHRENISEILCGSLLKLCGSLCNLIPEKKNRKTLDSSEEKNDIELHFLT
jgi:hypothetical protein